MNKITGLFILIISSFVVMTPGQNISAVEPLVLISEKPVEGMPLGNLSGMTICQNKWLVISDKDDRNIYQISENDASYHAKKLALPSILPLNAYPLFVLHKFLLMLRGSYLDFEGMACDSENNLYIVSEFNQQVLKLSPDLSYSHWLQLPNNLLKQAQSAQLLKYNNAKFEGIAINSEGNDMWLIAERENRGIVEVKKINEQWNCHDCVLLSEGYLVTSPKLLGSQQRSVDFADAMYFQGKLFTLERLQHQICRRHPHTAILEKCWSFEAILGKDEYQYGDYPFGQAEALWMDENNVWVGIDNNMLPNKSGDIRPVIYHFKAPKASWL